MLHPCSKWDQLSSGWLQSTVLTDLNVSGMQMQFPFVLVARLLRSALVRGDLRLGAGLQLQC